MITEPAYAEHANMYLFLGKENDLLIDCGLGVVDIKEFLLEQGIVHPLVTVTHAHFDHIGGLKFFLPEEMIIPTYVHKNLYTNELAALRYLREQDLDAKETERYVGMTPARFVRSYELSIPTVKAFEGNTLRAGGCAFRIIEAPGHTDDSVLFFDAARKILVTGDVVYDGERYDRFPNSDKARYVQTLTLMETLDFDMLLPGHNRILTRPVAMEIIARWKKELI